MAEGVESVQLWLPSEFLADDLLKEVEQKSRGEATAVDGPVLPSEFPFDFGTHPRSPLEAVTENEGGEQEYLAGLTLQMAHSFLQDDEDDFFVLAGNKSQNTKIMATSPSSTLSGSGIWSESGRTSPNGSSRVSSPPSTPMEPHKDDAWDMLYTAAGQVARLTLNDSVVEEKTTGRGLVGPPRNSSITTHRNSPTAGVYANPLLTQKQIRFEQLKQQQQLMKRQPSAAWGKQNKASSGERSGDAWGGRPLGLPSSAWPPLQPQKQRPQYHAGYEMRAVFLDTPGTRRASTGTGVFLPRRAGKHTETRNKSACSAILLPARVVQALNLNLDDMVAHQRIPGAFVLGHDALLARKNSTLKKQMRRFQSDTAVSEICLPADWTY